MLGAAFKKTINLVYFTTLKQMLPEMQMELKRQNKTYLHGISDTAEINGVSGKQS